MKLFKIFLLGIGVAAVFHFLQFVSCDEGDPISIAGTQQPGLADFEKIAEGAQKVEEAFASGNYKNVEAILTEQAKEMYKEELPNLTGEDMKKFAVDFKKRKLNAYGSMLAEYGFPFQETTYIVQLVLQADGSYKLLRF